MAFLPLERITVKRRRDEDPVEALFIQPKKQRPSSYWKLIDDESSKFTSPLVSSDPVKKAHINPNAFHSPQIPSPRTILPGEGPPGQKNADSGLSESTEAGTDPRPMIKKHQQSFEPKQARQSGQRTPNILRSALKTRKFHLIRSPSPLYSPNMVSKSTTKQNRKIRGKSLAVFVERTEIAGKAKGLGNVSSPSSGGPRHLDNGEGKQMSQLENPRKRPNATAVERKWRTENWANRRKSNETNENLIRRAENVNEPSNQWNYESIRLAEQLQEVALAEIQTSEEGAKRPSGVRKLKVKPKSPKPRQSRTEKLADEDSEKDVTPGIVDIDDDGDYVLDTYVRSSPQHLEVPEPAESYHDLLNSTDHGNIGILVIEDEEEEALWQAFAEDQESDLEGNSEEEDENAEDYYGNDYPEDEVSSDDEFGRGAYNYRHAASDDEEFGWSDEE
ncbi:hypothetical protein BDR22DRAFT_893589 [Usnea florida]